MAAPEGDVGGAGARGWSWLAPGGLKLESLYALIGLAVVWQIVSFFVPHFLFPSVPQIAARFVEIFTSWRTAVGCRRDRAAASLPGWPAPSCSAACSPC